MRFVNWSCLMSQVTFGNCFVNSSDSLNGRSNPVSKYAFMTTGSVPQSGVVAALAGGSDPPADGATAVAAWRGARCGNGPGRGAGHDEDHREGRCR